MCWRLGEVGLSVGWADGHTGLACMAANQQQPVPQQPVDTSGSTLQLPTQACMHHRVPLLREFLRRKFAGLVEVTVQAASGLPAADVRAADRQLRMPIGWRLLVWAWLHPAPACMHNGWLCLTLPTLPCLSCTAVVAQLQERPVRCGQRRRLGSRHLGHQPGAEPAVGRVLLPVCQVTDAVGVSGHV